MGVTLCYERYAISAALVTDFTALPSVSQPCLSLHIRASKFRSIHVRRSFDLSLTV
jgi:hypothetical protein